MTLTLCVGCSNDGAVSSDIPGAELPKAEIFVLVDMSETWFNPESHSRDSRVLREIGYGISSFAIDTEPPVLIEHREIGEASLLSEPMCSVFYMPSLVGGTRDNGQRIARPQALRRYLGEHCPDQILAGDPEPLTQISAALASVSVEPSPPGSRRFIIIASDFLEETAASAPLEPGSLRGVKVLLVFRPLSEDQADPQAMMVRVRSWQRSIERFGATVEIAPDPNLQRSRVTAFLSAQ